MQEGGGLRGGERSCADATVVLCRNVKSRITVVHNLLEMSTVAVKSSSVVLSS